MFKETDIIEKLKPIIGKVKPTIEINN